MKEPLVQGHGNATGDYRFSAGRKSRYATLTCDQVLEVRRLLDEGVTGTAISQKTGISNTTVSNIKNKVSYTYCK